MNRARDTQDTIVAISTPIGKGAVGIVRMSGSDSRKILKKTIPGLKGRIRKKRTMLGWVEDPVIKKRIDKAVVLFFKGPESYTGEDIVEIHGHGGRKNIRRILESVIKNGARIAEPGEFTYRAFINGKMDLSEAEAVAEIIDAKSRKACEIAVLHLSGTLGDRLEKLLDDMKNVLVDLEASMDFPEEDLDLEESEKQVEKLIKVKRELKSFLDGYKKGKIFKEGFGVGIAGKTNVGKSSLLNVLLGRNRAIVDEKPGTTRDFLEENLELDGILIRIIDTAGWRKDSDEIEKVGQEMARRELEKADMIICLADASQGVEEEDLEVWEAFSKNQRLAVWNKIDLVEKKQIQTIEPWGEKAINISAKEKTGIDMLEREIVKRLNAEEEETEERWIITEERQKECLERAHEGVENAINGFEHRKPGEFLAIDLRAGMEEIGKIIGKNVDEEVINEIFSRFCIGK